MLTKLNVLFASFILQFTASVLGFKVLLAPLTVNICGKTYECGNSKIGCCFEDCFWLKFNNLEVALSLALKFYTSVVKRLKLYVRKFWRLIPKFVGVTAEKLVGGPFHQGLNLFKTFIKVRYTLSVKISSGKRFHWKKFLWRRQYFVTVPGRKVFPQI